MKNNFLSICAAALASLFVVDAVAATATAPAIRPDAVILLDITRADKAMVAVGERGTVLRSEDEGQGWAAAPTDVTRTLTAVTFATESVGVAVGHGGTLIRSQDGGRTWRRVALPEIEKDSFLGVRALSARKLVAFGTFGLFMQSEDAGETWTRREVVGPEFDRHLYGMVALSPERWLVVGETGTLALTEDEGATWRQLPSPYQGSLFGVVQAHDGAVVIFGMRGNVFRSEKNLDAWTKVESGSSAAFNGGRVLSDGRVLLIGNNGLLTVSGDAGMSFSTIAVKRASNLAAGIDGSHGLVLAGEKGITHMSTTAQTKEPSRE